MCAVKRKLTNKSLKEKWNYPLCQERHGKQGGLWINSRAKEYYFNGDEMESFLLRFENLFSRESLFALKQTNMTGFFSKVGQMY